MPRLTQVLLLLASVSACAPPLSPGLSDELKRVRAAPRGADSIALMRQQGEQFAHMPFVPGNQVDLLVDGPATFAAMSDAIRGARTRIDMESYEFDNQAGGQFTDLLLVARSRGVDVNLVYDAWGTSDTRTALFDRLKQGGVRILEYNPIRPNDRVAIDVNRRDHRKLLCIDGQVCITGGVNISRVYENGPAPQGTEPEDQAWRDTDVRIRGPVVAQFERLFLETWASQHGIPLAPPPPAPPPQPGGLDVQVIDGAPGDGQPLIYRTLLASIALSERTVHLTTGFFVPVPDMTDALIAAARRGVDVSVVVPGQSNSSQAVWAGRAKYGPLLEAGVHIYERQGRVLHAKTAVIDGAWSAIGSSNLDWRSAIWNNEIDAIVLGPSFGQRMEALFMRDVAASYPIDGTAWRHRGPIQRIKELKASLLDRFL